MFGGGSQLNTISSRLGGLLIDVSLKSAAKLGKYSPKGRTLRSELRVTSDLQYVDGSNEIHHRLDVIRSERFSGPRPICIYIHGGGFRILSKDSHWMMSAFLAHQGFCVFSLNYGLAPKYRFPEGLADVLAAVEWVADHASEYGGDVDQIFIAGESAGANLSCGVTLAHCVKSNWKPAARVYERSLSIKAVSPACGFLDVSHPERFDVMEPPIRKLYRDRMKIICNSYVDETRAREMFASPLLWFESDAKPDRPLPPIFVGCGSADPVVDDSRRFAKALKKRGLDHEYVEYENAIHAFQAFFWQSQAKQFWHDQGQFVRRFMDDLVVE